MMGMGMFPVGLESDSASSTASAKPVSPPVSSRRAKCFSKLAGTRIEVFIRDGAVIRGILAIHGNQSLYPSEWGELPLSSEELSRGMRYVRATPNPDEGWRTIVGRRQRKQQEGRFEKLTKWDSQVLWLRRAQRRPSATNASSAVYDLLAITWRDIQGLTGTIVEQKKRGKLPSGSLSGGFPSHSPGVFQTDTQISGAEPASKEKVLKKWVDETNLATNPDDETKEWIGLDDEPQPWNQFEENSRMFGVKTTYDEELYTTQLNVKDIPEDVQRKAAEIAAEMNGGRHRDEDENEQDEEKKFSAVAGTGGYKIRSNLPNDSQGKNDLLRADPRHDNSRGGPDNPRAGPDNPRGGPDNPPRGGGDARHDSRADARGDHRHDVRHVDSRNDMRTAAADGSSRHSEKRKGKRDSVATTHDIPHEVIIRPKHAAVFRTLERRLPKDNINALNLEPIKRGTVSRNGAWGRVSADKEPQSRIKLLEEFSKSAKTIQSKMEKKGWTSPTMSGSAPAAAAPAKKEDPAAETPGSRTPTGAEGGSPPPPPPSRREDSFQFNPNANSFTPKGEAVPQQPPPPQMKDSAIAASLEAIDGALIHSAASCFNPPVWAHRMAMSYNDCLSTPVSYPFGGYGEVAYAPVEFAAKDPSAGGVALGVVGQLQPVVMGAGQPVVMGAGGMGYPGGPAGPGPAGYPAYPYPVYCCVREDWMVPNHPAAAAVLYSRPTAAGAFATEHRPSTAAGPPPPEAI